MEMVLAEMVLAYGKVSRWFFSDDGGLGAEPLKAGGTWVWNVGSS